MCTPLEGRLQVHTYTYTLHNYTRRQLCTYTMYTDTHVTHTHNYAYTQLHTGTWGMTTITHIHSHAYTITHVDNYAHSQFAHTHLHVYTITRRRLRFDNNHTQLWGRLQFHMYTRTLHLSWGETTILWGGNYKYTHTLDGTPKITHNCGKTRITHVQAHTISMLREDSNYLRENYKYTHRLQGRQQLPTSVGGLTHT